MLGAVSVGAGSHPVRTKAVSRFETREKIRMDATERADFRGEEIMRHRVN